MNRIKIGLIGCGKQSEKHISSLKKLNIAEIVVADINAGLAESLAAKQNVTWKKESESVICDADVQAILICTPTLTHAELIRKSLDQGKNVFCEKPLCSDLAEARALQKAEETTGKSVTVGYVYRYVPIFEEGFRLLSQCRINGGSIVLGKPLTAYFRLGGRGSHQIWKHRRNQGGGAVNEMLVHMIDLANWYFGPLTDIEVISQSQKRKERVIKGRVEAVDAEDYVMIRCMGELGIEIVCQADLITPAFTQYAEIQCENGTFMGSIQPEMPSFVFVSEGRGGYDSGRTDLKFGRRSVLDIQMTSFIQNVLNEKRPDRNQIADSIEIMKIVETIRANKEE